MRSAMLAACAIAMLGTGVAAAAQSGAWITDLSGGCQVWNPHPQPNETIRWFGACANGFAQGHGTAQWLHNDLPFEADEGDWLSGRQTGIGSQVWPSGRYDGQLVDGEPHGRGTLILQGARYEGEFRNGKPEGTGTLTRGSDTFRGTWTGGCFRDGTRRASFGVPLSACR